MTIVKYLNDNLSINGDFLRQYRVLEEKDKNELKEYAREEMELLGIEITTEATKK